MEVDIPELVKEFIVAYYTTLSYNFHKINKFYHPEKATLYCSSYPSLHLIRISEEKFVSIPNLHGEEKIVILKYNFLSIPSFSRSTNLLNVSVFGKIVKNEEEKRFDTFSQFFTLELINNRAVIISDSLTFHTSGNGTFSKSYSNVSNSADVISLSELYFEVPNPRNQLKAKRHFIQKHSQAESEVVNPRKNSNESNANRNQSSNEKSPKKTGKIWVYVPLE